MHQQIKSSLKEAMIAKDAVKLSVIRGLLSAFTNELVAKGRTPQDQLTDEEVIAVISRASKQRKDSIQQFVDGGRPELAESEKAELTILESYLPAQMSKEEIVAFVAKKKSELGITDKAQAVDLIKAVMPELKGKADGKLVKEAIDEALA
ncbi:MAG: GatB/YqeY domain-containing protein [Candidatus Paceibacterota bacterium]|jgi:hypothetical protein